MSETIITNTPRPGETPEQTGARTAPRRPPTPLVMAQRTAKLFYLTEPSRGVFVVNIQTWPGTADRIEITKDQLANFLVDGAAMALRDVTGRGK